MLIKRPKEEMAGAARREKVVMRPSRVVGPSLSAVALWSLLRAICQPHITAGVISWIERISVILTTLNVVLPAIAAASLLMFWALWAFIPRLVLWTKMRRLSAADLTVTILCSASGFTLVTGGRIADCRRLYLISFFATLILLIVRGLVLLAQPAVRERPIESSLFHATLGPGLSPLSDSSDDILERTTIVNILYQLIIDLSPQTALTLGLEGQWGSGKTSLLNFLAEGLEATGYATVRFDAWTYREPERLVSAYFAELDRLIARRIPFRGLSRQVRKLGAGLAEFAGGRVTAALRAMAGDFTQISLDSIRNNIADHLRSLEKPLVILVDDLDRLDSGELQAVLRCIRLVGDISGLVHVLAYDREQVARVLFQGSASTAVARDYFAKIVGIELSIGTPQVDLFAQILEKTLAPLLEAVGNTAAEELAHGIRHELHLFAEALPTPREVRRVGAGTAAIWQQMKRHLNVFDLFVLTILHLRYPDAYFALQAHAEWFFKIEWYFDPRRMLLEETWKKEREAFVERMQGDSSRDAAVALRLMGVLVPGLLGKSGGGINELEARRRRKFVHPSIYRRYFDLYVSTGFVSEVEIEDFADNLSSMPAGELRQEAVRQKLEEEIDNDRITSFWQQWSIIFEGGSAKEVERALVRDIGIGVAVASAKMPTRAAFLLASPLRMAAAALVELVAGLNDREEITSILLEVVRMAASLAFAGEVLFLTGERRLSGDKTIDADAADVRKAVSSRVDDAFGSVAGSLLGADEDALATALEAGEADSVRAYIVRDVKHDGRLLAKLLRTATPIQTSPEYGKVMVERFDPSRLLARQLPLEELADITKQLQLETWLDADDRELVRRFRAWIEQRTITAERTRRRAALYDAFRKEVDDLQLILDNPAVDSRPRQRRVSERMHDILQESSPPVRDAAMKLANSVTVPVTDHNEINRARAEFESTIRQESGVDQSGQE